MKRIKHRDLTHYFYKIIGAYRAPMLPAASAFLKVSSSMDQGPRTKRQAPSVKRQALIRTQLNSTNK